MTSKLHSQITFFFRSPQETPQTTTDMQYSTLYLLRRDIFTCFGINPNHRTGNEPTTYQALWPGIMALMAGIDLLAKFAYDDTGKVSVRFRRFIREYIDSNNENEIYQLRNSLMHSFGLYSEDKGNIYRFILGGPTEKKGVVHRRSSELYYINIFELHNLFESSIPPFQSMVLSKEYPAGRFEKMLSKYGVVEINPQ